MRSVFLTLLILLCTACYYENEEDLLNSDPQCDTSYLSYSEHIQRVLSNRCYACHDNENAGQFGGNIFLEDYADVVLRVEDGSLQGSINHQNGFSPMPRGGGKLDSCTLLKFSSWINQGNPVN